MEQTKSRAKKFINDIIVYGIGTLGSKIITFLLVPLYTFFVPVADYGYYDLCLTVILLMLGIVCLQSHDGVLKYLIEAKDEQRKRQIISSTYPILFNNSIVVFFFTLLISLFTPLHYVWHTAVLLIVWAFYEVEINAYRGLGLNRSFAAAGVITALLLLVFSLIFVVWLRMGIKGIFASNILARIVSLFFIEFKTKVLKNYFSRRAWNRGLNHELVRYSFPLMINSSCWWVIDSSNKFFIEHYLGLVDNGLYAVVLKFVVILHVAATIFYKAWQENALQQYASPDRDSFFSAIFNSFCYGLAALLIIYCVIVKLCYPYIVGSEYQLSIIYLCPLVVSAMIYSISTFFDLGYQCSGQTDRSMPSILIAVAVNVAGNFALIQPYGIFGIIASHIMSCSVMLVYRALDTRKYFKIQVSRSTCIILFLVLVNGAVFYLVESLIGNIIYIAVITCIIIALAPAKVKEVLKAKLMRH